MRVLVVSPLHPQALEALGARHELQVAVGAARSEVVACLGDADALVFRSGIEVDAELMEAAPSLRLLVRAGAGLDNVDLEHAAARGIRVARIPGVSARAVAELTFGLLLALARRVTTADAQLRRGEWRKPELVGNLLEGKTMGIVGVGHIGSQVGAMAAAWGMQVVGCVERYSELRAAALSPLGIGLSDFDNVLARSDVLSVHCNLHESTHHLIDATALSRVKPGAFLVNMARGGVVDEGALAEALRTGHLAGAALDVHEVEGEGIPELAAFENVVLTPHIGAMAEEAQERIGLRAVEIVDAFEQGRFDVEADERELVA